MKPVALIVSLTITGILLVSYSIDALADCKLKTATLYAGSWSRPATEEVTFFWFFTKTSTYTEYEFRLETECEGECKTGNCPQKVIRFIWLRTADLKTARGLVDEKAEGMLDCECRDATDDQTSNTENPPNNCATTEETKGNF